MIRNLKWILASLMLLACEENQLSPTGDEKNTLPTTQSGTRAVTAAGTISGKIFIWCVVPRFNSVVKI